MRSQPWQRRAGVAAFLGLLFLVDAAAAQERFPSFDHDEHASLECTECHVSEDTHGELSIRTTVQCQACHHDPSAATACEACHGRDELAGSYPVPQVLRLSVNDSTRRDLPFDHGRHGELACGECHGDPPDVSAAGTACSSCHREHHELGARCMACHVEVGAPDHPTERVHVTCAGSGCHAESPLPDRSWSRSVCLTCHQDMEDHEPEGDCASCHAIPRERVGPDRSGAARSGGTG